MKKYDFIIGYEHKNREIESICLLKYELERRGYSVLLYNTNDERFKEYINKFHARVLLVPAAYDDTFISFCVKRAISFDKLINLQWEQAIYKQQEDNPESYKSPSGLCKKAVHLSWGRTNVERLTQIVGIDRKNVKLVGNVTLDFLKKPLSDYYMSREQLFSEYSIPMNKKVCLFIASFKSATLDEKTLEAECKLYGEWRRKQHQVAFKTMQTILGWIQDVLHNDPELFFVYRPHPGERTDLVDEIQKKCDRFVVIKDLSVKQWILTVDKIYTWMSTAVAEVYFARKDCYMVYPYPLPEEAEGRLFDKADTIGGFDEFQDSLNRKQAEFPIDLEVLNEYYLSDKAMSYIKIADVCEAVLWDSAYCIDKKELKEIAKIRYQNLSCIKKMNLYLWQLDWFYNLFWILVSILPFKSDYIQKKYNDRRNYESWKREECVSEAEIEIICAEIKKCLKE